MEIFKTQEYAREQIPSAGVRYRREILTKVHQAKNLGGVFCRLPPGSKLPYHYHENRESLIMVIGGEGIEGVEGKETPIKAGDVLYIPAGEKHMMMSASEEEIRYLEFFTPVATDSVEVK